MTFLTINYNIAPGVTLRALQTDKFKTACFSVNFLRTHRAETAASDALLPSVLLRGSRKYPDMQQISVRLDELYGASFGTLVRRKGEIALPGFYADFIEDDFLPEGESIFEEMLAFLEDVLWHPVTEDGVFCEKFVEGEKQNLINTIESSLNDKRSYATQKMLEVMFRGEPYGVPRLGRVEDVEAITAESLWRHYTHTIVHCPVEIFYAGRKSPEEAAAAFAKVFAPRREAEWEVLQRSPFVPVSSLKEVSEAMDVTQGKLVMGLRTPIVQGDSRYASMSLLNAVLGSGMTSKLFVHVREDRSLCYYVSSTLEKYRGMLMISAGIDFDKYETAKAAILGELDACKQGNITQQELESARMQVLSSLQMALDVPARLDDFYLGMAILPGEDLPEHLERIRHLTAEDLAEAARTLELDTIFFLKGESE